MVVDIVNLSKCYRLGDNRARYHTLRDTLAKAMSIVGKRLTGKAPITPGAFWALREVNLGIDEGQVVGIIGFNGAGKSTLLKIISRITEPTSGSITLHGRVASLLEVGTGFHPELSGRENIYLNGTLMGMKRAEIRRRFDEIVTFAEIEKFIDTPVKYYSSGMYVRLAFAIAAHLEPEVFIVDEVLAVGDMAFQQKCLQKFAELRKRTKAIILVSHNMMLIKALCSRVVLFSEGRIAEDGVPSTVVPIYERAAYDNEKCARDETEHGTGHIRIETVSLVDQAGHHRTCFTTGESLNVEISYCALTPIENAIAYAAIRRPDGFICVGSSTKLEAMMLPTLHGHGTLAVSIPQVSVVPGHYVMDVTFYDQNFESLLYFLGRKRVAFQVTSEMPSLDDRYGIVYQKQHWKVPSLGTVSKE